MKARATAATPSSTRAYSAVVWPASLRSGGVRSATPERSTVSTSSAAGRVGGVICGMGPPGAEHGHEGYGRSEAQAADGAGEKWRHREQREGGKHAHHQREGQLHRRTPCGLV